MREEGLKQALEAVGGVAALARGLGIRQPSVSSWVKVPSERVLAVEALTGVRREALRPDLYAPSLDGDGAVSAAPECDEIEIARAREYLLLARLLRSAPTASLLADLARLKGDTSPLGMAHIELAEAAKSTTADAAANEYFSIFIGIGRGEILPYASYYLTGFLHEKPLANLREDLAQIGIERAAGNFDPEDHLGLLFEVMGGFANRTFDGDVARQQEFFERHIARWAARCFADIAAAPSARFYKAVGLLGARFAELEQEAFQIED